MSGVISEFKTTYNCVEHPLLLLDENGNIQDYNAAFARLYGKEANKIILKNLKQFLPDLAQKSDDNFEEMCIKKKQCHFLDLADTLKFSPHFHKYSYQNTDKKFYIATLNLLHPESEQWFEIITENVSDGLVILDKSLKILYTNLRINEFALQTNTDNPDIQKFIDTLNAESGGAFERMFTQKKTTRFEANLFREIYYETLLSPVFNSSGEICYIFEQIKDISIPKNTEKALLNINNKEANSIFHTDFLANITHETRTPLNGILGFSELLLEDPHLKEEHVHFVENILISGRHLLSLLEDIIELSRFEYGKVHTHYSYFSLKEMVIGICKSMEYDIREKNNHLSYDLSGIDIIYSDAARVNQLLINIIGNAVKFTQHGKITLNVKNDKRRYVFSVSDTGIGIPLEMQEKIFDEFRKANNGLVSSFHGIGIGLSLCKRIVTLLGGEISVQSVYTQGSTFTFTLPILESFTRINTGTETTETVVSQEPEKTKTLYIADDDKATLFYYSSILKKYSNYNCCLFSNGEELIKRLHENPDCDLIVLDIQMGGKSGVDCAKEIKQKFPHIPIIAATAHSYLDNIKTENTLPFHQIITKPISSKKLVQIINAIFHSA